MWWHEIAVKSETSLTKVNTAENHIRAFCKSSFHKRKTVMNAANIKEVKLSRPTLLGELHCGQQGGCLFLWTPVTHAGNLWFLQCQSVHLPHVRVRLQHKHGDHSLSSHDNHIWVSHRAMHYGRTQVHGDEVELSHWQKKKKKLLKVSLKWWTKTNTHTKVTLLKHNNLFYFI